MQLHPLAKLACHMFYSRGPRCSCPKLQGEAIRQMVDYRECRERQHAADAAALAAGGNIDWCLPFRTSDDRADADSMLRGLKVRDGAMSGRRRPRISNSLVELERRPAGQRTGAILPALFYSIARTRAWIRSADGLVSLSPKRLGTAAMLTGSIPLAGRKEVHRSRT